MIDGLEHIREAAETLATRDERLKARLAEAGKEVWSAMYFSEEWPTELEQKARTIQLSIMKDGPIEETVRRMSNDEASRVAGQILDLLVDLECASPEKPTEPGD
jgi:hypothetical protein